tara:strand:+ start:214 stop:423 length:210 start_codon:yes stop_codon:yes gene_type:complete
MNEDLYGRGGIYDITEEYKYIMKDVALALKEDVLCLWVSGGHPCGEDCIFNSRDEWLGYMSEYTEEGYE